VTLAIINKKNLPQPKVLEIVMSALLRISMFLIGNQTTFCHKDMDDVAS
jgi:hypothetical protein